jgi:hypothetical protein
VPSAISGQPFETTVRDQIMPFLKRYLSEVRPLIAARVGTTTLGRKKGVRSMARQFTG